MTMINFTLNGQPQFPEIDPETPLLCALRDHLGLTGTKFGCGNGRVLCKIRATDTGRKVKLPTAEQSDLEPNFIANRAEGQFRTF